MKFIQLTRAYGFHGSLVVIINFSAVEMICEINVPGDSTKSRLCFSGDDYIEVIEPLSYILQKLNYPTGLPQNNLSTN